MKEYQSTQTGGQEVFIAEDLTFVQQEALAAAQDQFADYGNFVLQGCVVSGSSGNYAITSGLVYLDGKIRRFPALTGIATLPRYIVVDEADEDERDFELSASAYVKKDYKAKLQTGTASQQIQVPASGAVRRFKDVIDEFFSLASTLSSLQSQIDGLLPKTGGTMSGGLNMGGNKVTNAGNATAAQDLVTKNQLDGKESTITGAATTITSSDLTINRALIANESGKVAVHPTVSQTELGHLNGVTSALQTQINNKEDNLGYSAAGRGGLDNMNDAPVAGVYSPNSGASNTPVTVSSLDILIHSTNLVSKSQIYIDVSTGDIYHRSYSPSTWGSWSPVNT